MTSSKRRNDVMTKSRLSIGFAGAIFVFLSVYPTIAQIDPRMPEGPNRALVARKCTSCHDASNFVGTAGRSQAGWDGKINDMITLYGMNITPEERALVLDYLATYLPQ
jgi:hypothetical protein